MVCSRGESPTHHANQMKLELITRLDERKAINGGLVTGGALFAAGLAGGGLANIPALVVVALLGFCIGSFITLVWRGVLGTAKRSIKRDILKTKILEEEYLSRLDRK